MISRIQVAVPLMLILLLAGSAHGQSSGDEQQLRDRVASLESQLARVLADRDESRLTEQRAEEIRGLVQDVLADADTRASLLQNGMNAGYKNGFFISSGDGNFDLKINGWLSSRFVYNHQDNGPVDDNRAGFESTRTKLVFGGHAISPQWRYKIVGNFNRNGGALGLTDAWMAYDYDNGWTVQVGQFKSPLLREELILHSQHQAVERTNVNEIYTADRVQGIMLSNSSDKFRFMASINDGVRSLNTPWSAYDTEFAATARAELLVGEGAWSRYKDLQSWIGDASGVGALLGAAVNYQIAEYGTDVHVDEPATLTFTIDGQVEFGGANLFVAGIYRNIDTEAGDTDQLAGVVQGGLFFNENWEGFVRWEWSDQDMTGVDDLNIVTLGVTRYYAKNKAKWTTDIGYGMEKLAVASDLTGWRVDGNDDGQIVIRTQWQLLF